MGMKFISTLILFWMTVLLNFENNGLVDIRLWSHKEIQSKFPKLCGLALGVLSILASSERVFSTCGNTITMKRSILSASSVDSVLVLNSFLNRHT